jgi:hypothetical protein
MAIKTKITFFQGEDVTVQVTVTGVNITGWALALAVATGYGTTPLFTKTTVSGITITDGAGGVFDVAIADIDTDALEAGGYVWEAKRTDAGQETVLAYGEFELKPRVVAT